MASFNIRPRRDSTVSIKRVKRPRLPVHQKRFTPVGLGVKEVKAKAGLRIGENSGFGPIASSLAVSGLRRQKRNRLPKSPIETRNEWLDSRSAENEWDRAQWGRPNETGNPEESLGVFWGKMDVTLRLAP